jgi:hypothetical protein
MNRALVKLKLVFGRHECEGQQQQEEDDEKDAPISTMILFS